MDTTLNNFNEFNLTAMKNINSRGFAYDMGCAIGFIAWELATFVNLFIHQIKRYE